MLGTRTAGQTLHQILGREDTRSNDGLADRCQAKNGRDLVIIESDNRNVLRYAKAGLANGAKSTKRAFV